MHCNNLEVAHPHKWVFFPAILDELEFGNVGF